MLPARPPAKPKPLKVSALTSPKPAPVERTKLNVAGVAIALGLTESAVRMRVHRKQWDLIPEPEPERELGDRYYWYADKVAAFKDSQK